MDFFTRQESSQRATRYLVVLFAIAFISIAIVTAIGAGFILGFLNDSAVVTASLAEPGTFVPGQLATVAFVAAGVLAVMLLASLYRAATLSRGGGRVARMLGATAVDPDTNDPAWRRLHNVVEEMAIASGLPVPEVYVLEEEPAINAFAAGLTHADAAVCVTRGALERLDRAELQGVVAHEFSHILNGDMRLNQKLVGYSFGILVLSLVGRWMLRSQRYTRRSKGGSSIALIGLGLIVVGFIGVFFSRLIKAAVSRQREVLADASAVQFTRDPSGLAGALKKIGGFTANFSATESEEVSHMLFGPGARSFRGLFATHPPLVERIQALEPNFSADGFTRVAEPLPETRSDMLGAAGFVAGTVDTDTALENAGRIARPELGASIHRSIPEELRAAANSRESGLLLVIAMAVSTTTPATQRQEALLAERLGRQRAVRCLRMQQEVMILDASLHLPLLELTIANLRQRPRAQIEFLFDLIERLAATKDSDALFDFVLMALLQSYLRADGAARQIPRAARGSLNEAAATLIGTIAAYGHDEESAARNAFQAALERLPAGLRPPAAPASLIKLRDAFPRRELDHALQTLGRLRPQARRALLDAVLAGISHDNRLVAAEVELFRAIAAILECPVPPLAAVPESSGNGESKRM